MSYYEIASEQKNYFLFGQRPECLETVAHFHSAIEFHFVESGELDVILDGERKTLRGGEGCFCDGFSVHGMLSKKDTVSFHLLGSKDCFERAFSFFNNELPPPFFCFDRFDLLRRLIELCNQRELSKQSRYATFAGAISILLAYVSQNTPFTERVTQKKNALVCNVLQYAEENLQNDLSLLSLSKIFGYSHEYLSRILHQYLSVNWKTYVNRMRVRKAERLLSANPLATVLEIAFECGFDSPNTFYRAYKKEFGKSPRQ